MQTLGKSQFPSTEWTLIARLRSTSETEARRALDELCAQYHYPLYCYIRRRGLDHHDAQDALHDFLARLLRLHSLETAEEEKGRLRAFLSTALQRFLINWVRDNPHRQQELSVDAEASMAANEECYVQERFTDVDTPERDLDRKWAQTLVFRVTMMVEEEYRQRGRAGLFAALKPALLRGGSLRGEDPAELAKSLEISENALRMAHSRLLARFGDRLKAEVRETVVEAADVKEEIVYLQSLFSGQ